MACPHVSGVVALGLSYAAQLHRHFKASEIIDLLCSTTVPVEPKWGDLETKKYYKYVTDLGMNYLNSMNLNNYRGKMGFGQVNAYEFLKAIEGSGVEMTFPNVTVALGAESRLELGTYFSQTDGIEVKLDDTGIAQASISAGRLTVKGLAEGQTSATVSGAGQSYRFVVTVRKNISDGGWL